MLPTYLINAKIASGNLRIVLPQWRVPSFTIYALYPSRRQLAPAVRTLLDYLVERFAVLPW
jgi:DNA-binding transcriptional LysR family regulator